MFGCAGDQRPFPPLQPGAAQLETSSDWNDIDAAVEVGAGQAECVVVRKAGGPQELERRYELRHVSGKEGVLVARIEPGRSDPQPVWLGCSVGPLGDRDLERTVVDRVASRLSDLCGREVAPIRE